MPVLVVNLAAGFGCGEKVQLRVAERELTAVVSGRCFDDTDEPAVYMSYETALALYISFLGFANVTTVSNIILSPSWIY